MDLELSGARVLVTAGAAGIGRAVALAFAAEGARVHVCDVDPAALAALRREAPEVSGDVADVADRAAVRRLFGSAAERLGGLDVLVNNAGVSGPTGRVEDVDPADWDRCLAVCLTGQFNCARLAIPCLRRSANASIVNLSSLAGRLGFPLRSAYAAAKWGVIGFTKTLAMELGDARIRVNAVLPGIVAGERQVRVLTAKAERLGVSYEEMERRAFSYTAIKDYVTADDIAAQILFLASPRGAKITGQAISVCGDTQMLG